MDKNITINVQVLPGALVDPNIRSLIDPNCRALIDPNFRARRVREAGASADDTAGHGIVVLERPAAGQPFLLSPVVLVAFNPQPDPPVTGEPTDVQPSCRPARPRPPARSGNWRRASPCA